VGPGRRDFHREIGEITEIRETMHREIAEITEIRETMHREIAEITEIFEGLFTGRSRRSRRLMSRLRN
jgi:hypothetical protein